jgi:hypothetical protein
MAMHSKQMSTIKAKMETFEIKKGRNIEKMIFQDNIAKTFENQQLVFNVCLHAADISGPAKQTKVSTKWTELVFYEFFEQGDLEKKANLPVSLLCDRDTTHINKSQIGFINFVVAPLFDVLFNFIPEINTYCDNIKVNLKRYENLIKEEERKNSKKR